MKKTPLLIANAQGFWGDRNSAAATLLSQRPEIDFITFDYLAEVSLSIMAIQKEKNPQLGYAEDFLEVIKSLIPFWKKGLRPKLISNAGGLNPQACAQKCSEILKNEGLEQLKIRVVNGDDVLDRLKQNPDLPLYQNLETGQPLTDILPQLVTANAYLGAKPIVDALNQEADIVITGRVADPSLTVAPAAYHYKWDLNDYKKIAQATVAGHLIECGTQVTGGISTNWLQIPSPETIGYPIVEMEESGDFVITKPKGSGGVVNLQTVKEQLLYEIGDPNRYLSPDATVSFTKLQVDEIGNNRVSVKGAIGSEAPSTWKVSATYRDGFRADGMLVIIGKEAVKKAKKCGEILLKRVSLQGFSLEHTNIECLGNDSASLGILQPHRVTECVLKVSARDHNRQALECFVKEFAPLVTSGPQGLTGYLFGRPKIRPVFGYWPCLVTL